MNLNLQIDDAQAARQLGHALGRKMEECERMAMQLVALYRENEQLKQELKGMRDERDGNCSVCENQ